MKNNVPELLDSGTRRVFSTGANRDMAEGKGRADLLELSVASFVLGIDNVLLCLHDAKNNPSPRSQREFLGRAFQHFCKEEGWSIYHALLELAIHFEAGAKKYGDDNWKKGMPTRVYMDSATRHYLKHKRGDTDEPHHRAFLWNLMAAMWTIENKPELNDMYREPHDAPQEDK